LKIENNIVVAGYDVKVYFEAYYLVVFYNGDIYVNQERRN